jgi:restriction system protein
LVTVRTSRDLFLGLDLRNVEPLACLKGLNAAVSKSPSELVPVRPILEFDMVDPRFIQESDVLRTLDERPNLMELTPGEFESLITNLFEKMGLDTKQTQASRDGGVDCVAYDPRPIFGYGKSSFEFASNKPLELLSGTNLLYLLSEHAGIEPESSLQTTGSTLAPTSVMRDPSKHRTT